MSKEFDTTKPVLIIGGANHVYKDIEKLKEIIYPYNIEEFFYINVVNEQIFEWSGRVDIFSTLHGEKCQKWFEQRSDKANWDFKAYIHNPPTWKERYQNLDYKKVRDQWGGSSGLHAVQVSLIELGFDKVVLVGVPMDAKPNYFREEDQWKQFNKYRKGWNKAIKENVEPFPITNYVRSMSGWTREILGAPTKEFLGVENMEDYIELVPVGKDELERVFKVEGVDAERKLVVLESENNTTESRLSAVDEGKYLVVLDWDTGYFETMDSKPTKSEVKEMIVYFAGKQELESQEVEINETEVNETEVNEESVEEVVQEPVKEEKVEEPPKKTKNQFDAWWETVGQELANNGFTRKSIGVRCAREMVDSGAIWTDVQGKIGRDSVQTDSIYEMCKKVSQIKKL